LLTQGGNMNRITWIGVLGAVFVAGVAFAGTSAGAPAKPGSMIAFSSNRGGDTEIYAMHPDGTGVRRLTHSPQYDAPAQWSPDGRKLLFYSQRTGGDVWVMNADGTGQRNLTRNPAFDAPGGWSPDGKRIVFESDRDNAGDIYVMNADGSGVKRLTE